MTDELQKKAAVILAIADRITHGEAAKPAGYWGVVPMENAHALDCMTKNMSSRDLAVVLDRLTGAVV